MGSSKSILIESAAEAYGMTYEEVSEIYKDTYIDNHSFYDKLEAIVKKRGNSSKSLK